MFGMFRAEIIRLARHRDLRLGTVMFGGELMMEWHLYERLHMLGFVNEMRYSRDLPSAKLNQIYEINTSASGHSDYVDQFAWGCAFLAVGDESL